MERSIVSTGLIQQDYRHSWISVPYLIVQITDTNDIRIETPDGNSVPAYIVPQTSLEAVNLESGGSCVSLLVLDGIKIKTITRAMMLKVDPTLLKLAIHFVGMLLMHP